MVKNIKVHLEKYIGISALLNLSKKYKRNILENYFFEIYVGWSIFGKNEGEEGWRYAYDIDNLTED
ncbi:MAG: hypothetical protein V1872_14935 [bacterium]